MTPLLLPYLALLSLFHPWSTSFALPSNNTAYAFTLLLYTILFKQLFKSGNANANAEDMMDRRDIHPRYRFLPQWGVNIDLLFFSVNILAAAWKDIGTSQGWINRYALAGGDGVALLREGVRMMDVGGEFAGLGFNQTWVV